MEIYFRSFPDVDKSKLQYTPESIYSVSYHFHAKWLAKMISKTYTKNITIADVCSNVGGNTIEFLLEGFKKVISIEIDKKTSEALINNIGLYSSHIKGKSEVINIDANLYDYTDIDCFFIDPPWGGKNFKEKKKLQLFIGDIPLWKFINKHCIGKPVFIKVPFNFAFTELETNTDRKFKSYPMRNIRGKLLYFILYSS